MLVKKSLPVLCLLLLVSIAPAVTRQCPKGDICDDINELANVWNDVAIFMNESGDEQISDSDFRTLQKSIGELADATYSLADALIDLGNDKETKLGANMRKTMTQLANANSKAQVVDLIGKLVDILDETTDYCDNPNE